jgi:biopolymer transport protein ExbD
MDDFFEKPERKHIRELNLVPVIDMFTTVIFFLLLSTSFYAFTKLTLPPSKVSVNTDPLTPPPLSTKLVIGEVQAQPPLLTVKLSWVGESPGEERVDVSEAELETKVRELVSRFHDKFPAERTIQLGMSPSVRYQSLILAMDGAREKLPDIVLISPEEAATRLAAAAVPANGSGSKGASR